MILTKRLYTYIFKEHFLPFFGAVSVISLLFLTNFLLRSLDRLLGKNLGFQIIFEFIVLNMAWILAMAIPMAVLISVLMVYGRLGEDNEITALRASGISFNRIIIPSIVFAVLVMISLLYFNNNILPGFNYKARLLRGDIYRKHPDLNLDPGYFITDIPNYTLYITEKDENLLKGLIIFHTREDGRRITIWANSGELTVKGNHILLMLYHGEIHEYPGNEDEDYRILDFEKHQIIIEMENLVLERRENARKGDREMSIPEMLKEVHRYKIRQKQLIIETQTAIKLSAPDSLNFDFRAYTQKMMLKKDSLGKVIANLENQIDSKEKRLLQRELVSLKMMINRLDSNSRIYLSYQKQINRYMVEIHKKISMPVACIIFIMVGAPLGMMARRGGMTIASAFSLFFFLIYWAFMMAGERLSDRNLMAPWVSMWLPDIVFGFVGVFLIWFAVRERITISIKLPGFLKLIKGEEY